MQAGTSAYVVAESRCRTRCGATCPVGIHSKNQKRKALDGFGCAGRRRGRRYSSWTAPSPLPPSTGSWGGLHSAHREVFAYEKKIDRDGAGRRISHHYPTTLIEHLRRERMIESSLASAPAQCLERIKHSLPPLPLDDVQHR